MAECPCGNCVCGNKFNGITHVCIVLDESGSMEYSLDGTLSGFNEYIQTIKKNENSNNMLVSLVKFNTVCNTVFSGIRVAGVPNLTNKNYKPDGGTAIYDAVIGSINAVSEQMSTNDRVLVLVITDGGENSSKNNLSTVKNLIAAKTELGNWTFTFMGANQDAWLTASTWGIPVANSVNYSSTNVGTRSAFATAASATSLYASSYESSAKEFYGGTQTVPEDNS